MGRLRQLTPSKIILDSRRGWAGKSLGSCSNQAERFGAEIEMDQATSVDLSQQPYVIETYGKKYLATSLIITTGADPKKLNIPGKRNLPGGVYLIAEPVMDGSSKKRILWWLAAVTAHLKKASS